MGEPFERSNQATAGSPRIGKGSPNERSQGGLSFCQPLPHGINCANRIVSVHLSALPDSGRATRGLVGLHNVEKKADEGVLGDGNSLSLCLPR